MEIKTIIKLILTLIAFISFIIFLLLQDSNKKYIALAIELIVSGINLLIF